jgi:DNA-binding CsgD family transcriptional regulator
MNTGEEMGKSIFARVGRVLVELHRDCRQYPEESFPEWAMGLVKKAIRFDSCFWGTADPEHGQLDEYVCCPEHSRDPMPELEAHKARCAISARLKTMHGTVHNLTNAQLQQEEIYHLFLRKVGIEQLCGIYACDASTGLTSAISISRSDPDDAFLEEERQALECLIPNLIEARRASFLSGNSWPAERRRARQFLIAATRKGGLLSLDGDVKKLLRKEGTAWADGHLPDFVLDHFSKGETVYRGSTLMLTCTPTDDMYLLRVRPLCKMDELSQRQKEVAAAYSRGLSHKEVGLMFDIAPDTVRNHLSKVYKILDINNKTKLGMLFAQSGDDNLTAPA